MIRYRVIAAAFAGVTWFGFLLLLEAFASASHHWAWVGVWALGAVGVAVGGVPAGHWRLRLGLMLALVGVGVGLSAWDWDTRKPFLRDLDRIQPGMSAQEADALMSRWIVGTGWPTNPLQGAAPGELQLPDSRVYRHTNEGWGDSDWGIVRFQNGRVVSVEFSHD